MLVERIQESEIDNYPGFFLEYGCHITGGDPVVIQGKRGYFVTSSENFIVKGALIEPSPALLHAIGGLPITEEELLAKRFGISIFAAAKLLEQQAK